MDKRFLLQLIMLVLLIAFPVTMIVINGMTAVRSIVSPINQQEDGLEQERVSTEANKDAKHRTRNQRLRFGVYDPEGIFPGDANLKLRHVYVSWASFRADELIDQLTSLEQNGFEILLTIEPWVPAETDQPLLPAVVEGAYDRVIDELAALLGQLKGPVYVAWGHEMDQKLTERYPWSGQEPGHYIAAYRYVVDRINNQVGTATEIHWVWAAVMNDGSMKYWPGDDYVDFIGMPVYSFPDWDRQNYGFIRDFQTTFEDKRRVVAGVNKPLMITELGVNGSGDFESFWLHQAFVSLENYPDLSAVVFFYARDTEGAWGSEIETPDWRVNPEAIRGLVEWKLETPVE